MTKLDLIMAGLAATCLVWLFVVAWSVWSVVL